MDKLGINLSPQGYNYNVFSLVDKPGIHEIWTFKLNLTMKININQSSNRQGA